MVAVELECSKKQPKLFYNTWFLYSRRRNKLSRRQGIVEPCSKTLHRQIALQATCILRGLSTRDAVQSENYYARLLLLFYWCCANC